MTLIRSFSLIVLALSLAACGFQLRGSEHPLAASFESVRLITNGSDEAFYAVLKQALKDSNVRLNDSSDNALEILEDTSDKRTASYSSRAKSAEYELLKTIKFQFRHRDRELIPPTSIQSRRTYLYRETAAVGKAEEEVLLRQEMDQDLAQRVLLVLQRAASASASEAPR